jgi:AbrB family looped-hinge helix DNA binding protein
MESAMTRVTVSSKYRIVIPKKAQRLLSLRVGQQLLVVVKHGTITLLPDRPFSSYRGFLAGMSISDLREKS